MRQFDVYTKPGCGWCQKAKYLLESKSATYVEKTIGVNATKDEIQQRIQALGQNIEVRTVPQIFISDDQAGDTYLGGFEDLNRYFLNGGV